MKDIIEQMYEARAEIAAQEREPKAFYVGHIQWEQLRQAAMSRGHNLVSPLTDERARSKFNGAKIYKVDAHSHFGAR